MANVPQELQYTAEHEYVRRTEEEGVAVVGITDYAQDQLGAVVCVERPAVGGALAGMHVFGTIAAVKAVSELFAPIAGEVVEISGALDADPALVSTDPYGNGWMIRLRVADPSELEGLMDAE